MSTRRPAVQPSPANLREAALRHLARYATTQARLTRVLDRRIERWLHAAKGAAPDGAGELAEHAAAARRAARQVVAALAASGVINDTVYAEGRARTLLRAGKSRAKAAQHLAQRGIDAETIEATLPHSARHDLAAALLLTRKRRLGAFAPEGAEEDRARALGILARAGFSHATAARALRTSFTEAEQRIEALKRS